MIQSLSCIYGSWLNSLQHVDISLVLSPELDIAHRPDVASASQPTGNTLSNAAQDIIGLLCTKGTFLTHAEPGVHQDPQLLFWQTAFQLDVWGCSPPVQDLAVLIVHEVPVGPFFQSVNVPMYGSTALVYQPLLLVVCHLQTCCGYTAPSSR